MAQGEVHEARTLVEAVLLVEPDGMRGAYLSNKIGLQERELFNRWVDEANVAFSKNDIREARRLFMKAQEIFPKNADVAENGNPSNEKPRNGGNLAHSNRSITTSFIGGVASLRTGRIPRVCGGLGRFASEESSSRQRHISVGGSDGEKNHQRRSI